MRAASYRHFNDDELTPRSIILASVDVAGCLRAVRMPPLPSLQAEHCSREPADGCAALPTCPGVATIGATTFRRAPDRLPPLTPGETECDLTFHSSQHSQDWLLLRRTPPRSRGPHDL